MQPVTREQIIDAFESGWGSYVSQVQALSADEQAEFLKEQGYAALGDLLAHVIAWWELALVEVPRVLVEPDFHGNDIDVDAFNARAVARFQGRPEAEMIALFETRRADLVELVMALPVEAVESRRINERLFMESIGHLGEHRING
jgi:hypothetical protein